MIIRHRGKTIAEQYEERQAKEQEELRSEQHHRGKTMEEMSLFERQRVKKLMQKAAEHNKRQLKSLGINYVGNLEIEEVQKHRSLTQ